MLTNFQYNNLYKLQYSLRKESPDRVWKGYFWVSGLVGYAIEKGIGRLRWDGNGGSPVCEDSQGNLIEYTEAIDHTFGKGFRDHLLITSITAKEAIENLDILLKDGLTEATNNVFADALKGIKVNILTDDTVEVTKVNPAIDPHDVDMNPDNVQHECNSYEEFTSAANGMIKNSRHKGKLILILQDDSPEYLIKALQDYTAVGYNVYINQAETRLVFLF